MSFLVWNNVSLISLDQLIHRHVDSRFEFPAFHVDFSGLDPLLGDGLTAEGFTEWRVAFASYLCLVPTVSKSYTCHDLISICGYSVDFRFMTRE